MNIRNFCIIAHIDAGKSTLADRFLELTGTVEKRKMHEQYLDQMDLERERGITIKLQPVRMAYIHDEKKYELNLIDTPGHVDFAYEVSRSLASVEGAGLVVDSTQGIQAQTLANFNLSLEAGVTIIPVINKIDSPAARIEETVNELSSLGFKESEILKVSAKTGEGVEPLIAEIIKRIPEPKRLTINNELSVLIFDSSLDPYKGVVATIRMFGGEIKKGREVLLIATGARTQILELGYLTPTPKFVDKLSLGEVGFIVTNLKDISAVKVGDTITSPQDPASPLPGYQEAKPVVFLSFYPTDPHD